MANEANPIEHSEEVAEDEFLYSAFVWEKSNEGHVYWMDIQDKLDKENGWVVI